MTGNKEAYFYLASSLVKNISRYGLCEEKRSTHNFKFLKESFQHFCLYMEAAVITMAKGNILQKALLMR